MKRIVFDKELEMPVYEGTEDPPWFLGMMTLGAARLCRGDLVMLEDVENGYAWYDAFDLTEAEMWEHQWTEEDVRWFNKHHAVKLHIVRHFIAEMEL